MYALLGAWLWSCQKPSACIESPDVSHIEMDVSVTRFEQLLFEAPSKEEIGALLDQHALFAKQFLGRRYGPDDSLLVESLYALAHDERLDTLYQDTQAYYADLTDIETQFATAFRHIRYYYPDFQPPAIYTVVSGFGSDVFMSDSLIVIGLEYFLGEAGRYQPNNVPIYIQKRMDRHYLVPSIITLLSDRFIAADEASNTLLAEMLYYGKAYYFTRQVMPCTPDSLIIGYSSEELADVRAHEARIWSHLVSQQLLFETSHFEISRYVGERPNVAEIGPRCPGRIGRWVGWEILRRYVEKTGADLPALLNETNAQHIFEQARYKPRPA